MSLNQVGFYHEDAINDTQYNNVCFYVSFKKKDSSKMKPMSFNVDSVYNNQYLQNFEFNENYDYYISPNVFKGRNGKTNENLFSIQIITIDVDCHRSDVSSYTLKKDIGILKGYANQLHFPVSATVDSGRGVQLQFRIEKVSYKLKEYVLRIVDKLMEEVQNIIDKCNLCLEVDEASRNLAGYFRLANSINTKNGEVTTFTIHSRKKYKFQDMADHYHIFKKKEDYTNVYTKNSSKVTKRNNQLLNLHNKRIKTIIESLNNLEVVGNLEGHRDIHLFLACVSYYFLNKKTCLSNLKKLNSLLSSPLANAEIEKIYSYVSSKNGMHFKNETFFKWLKFNSAQKDEYNAYKISREQSKERTQKRLSRNEQIISLYNGKNIRELAEKFNLSERQIRNIVKEKKQQLQDEKYRNITNLMEQGMNKEEISKITNNCTATIYNIINRYTSIQQDTQSNDISNNKSIVINNISSMPNSVKNIPENGFSKNGNTCPVYVVRTPFVACLESSPYYGDFLASQLFLLLDLDEHSYPYLNKYDLAILKTLYAFTSYKYNDTSLSMSLSVEKLYYLCLPEWTLYKPYFENELGRYKSWISTAYDTLVFPDGYNRYTEWGDKYTSTALTKIRQALRKFVYLGFINADRCDLYSRYEYFSVSLNALNFEVASQRYADLKRKGLSFSHLVCDNYVSMHLNGDLGNNILDIRFKGKDSLLNSDVLNDLNAILDGKDYILWSSLSNRLKVFATRFENVLDGYCILKIRNKTMLQSLFEFGIQGVHIGSKIIVKVSIAEVLNQRSVE